MTANLPRTPALLEGAGRRWLAEPMEQPGVVYLFGGGHVSQALVPVLAPLGFSCVVLEDRPEYADPARFPGARAVRLVDFSRLAEQLQITEEDYLCIMTRGHEHDLLVQQQVLASPARYIGLMGSRRKAEASRAKLAQLGFSPADIARIVTPIGLPLGGKSPAEIAVSIAAQLIRVRSGLEPGIGGSGT